MLESQLYNKSTELQEDISLKKFDLYTKRLHLAAIRAQVSLNSALPLMHLTSQMSQSGPVRDWEKATSFVDTSSFRRSELTDCAHLRFGNQINLIEWHGKYTHTHTLTHKGSKKKQSKFNYADVACQFDAVDDGRLSDVQRTRIPNSHR